MPRCTFSEHFSRFGLDSSPIDEPAILLEKRMSLSYEEHRIDAILALTSNNGVRKRKEEMEWEVACDMLHKLANK